MSSLNMSRYNIGMLILRAYILVNLQFVFSEDPPLINKICDLTGFSEFCKEALESYYHHPAADIDDFAYISMNLVIDNATATKNEIRLMKKHITELSKLRRLKACQSKFEIVIDNMHKAKQSWRDEKYVGTKTFARKSIDEVNLCKYEDHNREFPLDEKILMVTFLLGIVETIADNHRALRTA